MLTELGKQNEIRFTQNEAFRKDWLQDDVLEVDEIVSENSFFLQEDNGFRKDEIKFSIKAGLWHQGRRDGIGGRHRETNDDGIRGRPNEAAKNGRQWPTDSRGSADIKGRRWHQRQAMASRQANWASRQDGGIEGRR